MQFSIGGCFGIILGKSICQWLGWALPPYVIEAILLIGIISLFYSVGRMFTLRFRAGFAVDKSAVIILHLDTKQVSLCNGASFDEKHNTPVFRKIKKIYKRRDNIYVIKGIPHRIFTTCAKKSIQNQVDKNYRIWNITDVDLCIYTDDKTGEMLDYAIAQFTNDDTETLKPS